MSELIAIALKSLLIGSLTLGLLYLMRRRSAAERSWVAHTGILALLITAFAPLALPSWKVEAPELLGRAEAPAVTPTKVIEPISAPLPKNALPAPSGRAVVNTVQRQAPTLKIDPIGVATALYAVPAAVLLFITFLALARLVALQARAEVLVDGHWLSALARAQKRMGFKHGTALLTSNELASPISWGLMRPVILLNSRAVEATDEAEAIIAHELAHVARLDWIKLLLARVATALFWFNPLVWLLAREAHQLREEAADDSVLAANIADTDYAQLLVGVARHECPGLLLGAHGVAPSKSSLARRVARVLDVKSARGPAARGFALGVVVGAILVATPLAALTLTPAAPKDSAAPAGRNLVIAPQSNIAPQADEIQADLPHIIAHGVATSVATAVAAASNGAGAPDAKERARIARESAREAGRVTRDVAREARDAAREADRADRLGGRIKLQLLAVTPEYIGAMRAAAPRLANLNPSDFAGMKVIGVTPEFTRELAGAGFPAITADELVQARSLGVTGDYVRAMREAGVRGDLNDFVELRAVGVDPAFAARVRLSGVKSMSPNDLVEVRALRAPAPPAPPTPMPRMHQHWHSDSNPDG